MIKTFSKNQAFGNHFQPKMYANFFDSLLNETLAEQPKGESAFSPRTDISETPTHFYFKVALPGISKEDLRLELEENVLKISATRTFQKEEETKYHLKETFYGNFERAFKLSKDINHQSVDAKFINGILEISIEKLIVEKKSSIIEVK